MARIIETTEDQGLERIAAARHPPSHQGRRRHLRRGDGRRAARRVKYLVAFTQSGDSARRMSRLRSRIPLLAFTPGAGGALASSR